VGTEDRLDDIFRTCCDINSQIHTLIEAVKTLSAEVRVITEEIRQLKDTTLMQRMLTTTERSAVMLLQQSSDPFGMIAQVANSLYLLI
jgi:cell division protein FtsB